MLGAIAGDIIGSPHEFRPHRSVEFELLPPEAVFTDDTVLTVATAFTLLTDGDYAQNYKIFGRLYPSAGWGGHFQQWLRGDSLEPYGSFGNGSAMRVAPVAWALESESEVLREARRSAEVTHDHPEGVKGAQAVALAVFLARRGADQETIRREIGDRFGYDVSRHPDDIRPGYRFDETCPGSVPEALCCFLAARDFEDAVRLAVSLGGDADTQACIAGAVAEAAFGVPDIITTPAVDRLTPDLREVVEEFRHRFRG
ncbi:MAG: ADP-ribosylglycohydrolase family protein [Candidatus Krumholzibacteriia bacterium]